MTRPTRTLVAAAAGIALVGALSLALTRLPGAADPAGGAAIITEATGATEAPAATAATAAAAPAPHYVGSSTCGGCHPGHEKGWLSTLHPKQEQIATPATIIGEFPAYDDSVTLDLNGIPVRPFREGDRYFVEAPSNANVTERFEIVRVIGGNMYKQRYVALLPNGADAVLPIEWNLSKERFQPYHAPSGYKPGQAEYWAGVSRAWALRCAGCHTVGLELEHGPPGTWPKPRYTELGVGCESCHGPGSLHAERPSEHKVVNPAHLKPAAQFAVCASCHSRGYSSHDEGSEVRVEWPENYRPGDPDIHRVFHFSEPLNGLSSWAFWGNRRSRQHHQQGNDFERSLHYQRAGMTCITCHESHGKARYAGLREEARDNTLCVTCHDDRATPERLTAHTHHAADSAGSQCIACHMPKVVTHANKHELRSHTFWKPSPAIDAKLRVPEACTLCHTDQTRRWAADALDAWRFGEK